jgi:adenine-specific DNA-methyltransferase
MNYQSTFTQAYDRTGWKEIISDLFPTSEFYRFEEELELSQTQQATAERIVQFGMVELADNEQLALFEVELQPNKRIAKSRVGLRNLISNQLIPGLTGGALVCYFIPGEASWRFSFIHKTETLEGMQETHRKRYTYLLGENETCKTAVERFEKLSAVVSNSSNHSESFGNESENHSESSTNYSEGFPFDPPSGQKEKLTTQHLLDAFSVEKVSKAFFEGYKKNYTAFVHFLTGKIAQKEKGKYVEKQDQAPSPFLEIAFGEDKESAEKKARDFVKKLLGRIVFLYFLQKKGWLGVPEAESYGKGEPKFMQKLFAQFGKEQFYQKALVPLFFQTLNTNRAEQNDIFPLTQTKIPYLNGQGC